MIAHMTVQAAIAKVTEELDRAGIDSAARDARLLIAMGMGTTPDRLTLHMGDRLEPDQAEAFQPLFERRLRREPMSHILGRRAFWGREFAVTPDVLDPRPETETLIEAALQMPFRNVLDLGTGSGCILLTLLAETPSASGLGADLSDAALSIARQNAEALGVADRCDFVQSDWWQNVTGRFDLVVSNPPYIALSEMAGLAPELAHEPRMALTDEGDGLGAYRVICAGVRDHLASGGRLIVEIGWQQGAAVAGLFRAAGFVDVAVLPDLDGRDRVVAGFAP